MVRYTFRRLLWLPIILFGVSLIAFGLLRWLPGQEPEKVIAGQGATEEQLERLRTELGLDEPVFPVSFSATFPFIEVHDSSQYTAWLGDLASGEFGRSYFSQKPIRDEFRAKFILSFEIVLLSLFFSCVFGITLGILSAMYRNTILDYVCRVFAVLGSSIPEFFLLALLIIIPTYLWNYSMPVGGDVDPIENPLRNLRLMLPPALIIGLGGSAGLLRLTRTTMLEVLRSDYIRTAHSKGIRERVVIVRHAMRNAGTPIATSVGTAFIAIFGGSVIAERVLSINGLGLWFFQASVQRDLAVVQFLIVYTAFVVVLANLIVDLSYAWIDPRVKYS